jgi:RNA polymerase sigma factor (sigma-70 family)
VDDTDAAGPRARPARVSGLAARRDMAVKAPMAEWVACYKAEMPPLIRYLMKCFDGSDVRDAADAAQSAFAELFTRWDDVRSPRTWLRTVAFRQMLRKPADYPLGASCATPLTHAASAQLELREQEMEVLAALRELPLAQRQVVALMYDQFSYREIAEITGKTEVAVRKNAERARAALKERLRNHNTSLTGTSRADGPGGGRKGSDAGQEKQD